MANGALNFEPDYEIFFGEKIRGKESEEEKGKLIKNTRSATEEIIHYSENPIKEIHVGEYILCFKHDIKNKTINNQYILEIFLNGEKIFKDKCILQHDFNYEFYDNGKIFFIKTTEGVKIYEIINGKFILVKKGGKSNTENIKRLLKGEIINFKENSINFKENSINIYIAINENGEIKYLSTEGKTENLGNGIFKVNDSIFKFKNGKLYKLNDKKYTYIKNKNKLLLNESFEKIDINNIEDLNPFIDQTINFKKNSIENYIAMGDDGKIAYLACEGEIKKFDNGIFKVSDLILKFENGKLYKLNNNKYTYIENENKLLLNDNFEKIDINNIEDLAPYINEPIKNYEYTTDKFGSIFIEIKNKITDLIKGTSWRQCNQRAIKLKTKAKEEKEKGLKGKENKTNSENKPKIITEIKTKIPEKKPKKIKPKKDKEIMVENLDLKPELKLVKAEKREPRRIRIIN